MNAMIRVKRKLHKTLNVSCKSGLTNVVPAGTRSPVVGLKFFVSRFYYKSHIFQPVLLQKVVFSSE